MIDNKKINKEDMKNILDSTINWIQGCDTKASIILSAIGMIIGVLLSTNAIGSLYTCITNINDSPTIFTIIFLLCLPLSIICLILSIYYLLNVLTAKIDIEDIKKEGIVEDSILFFASIAKYTDVTTYKEKVYGYSEQDLIDDITSQIYICSLICKRKYENYKSGLKWSIWGMALLFLSVGLSLI